MSAVGQSSRARLFYDKKVVDLRKKASEFKMSKSKEL